MSFRCGSRAANRVVADELAESNRVHSSQWTEDRNVLTLRSVDYHTYRGAVIIEYTGLQTSSLTWAIALGLLAVWALSLPLLVRIRHGWEQLFMSLLGLTWTGFGVGIVWRFFVLAYDAETFSSPSTKLLDREPHVVNLALVTAGVFWLCFLAAALATRTLRTPEPWTHWLRQSEPIAKRSIVAASIIAALCLTVSLIPSTPASLITPLAVLGSMWVIPATIIWVAAFSGESVSRKILAVTLAPGILRAVLSPYREHILVLVLVILVAAVFAGRRLRIAIVVPAATVVLLVSTVFITTYRQVIWMEVAADEAIARVSLDEWEERPFDAPWTEILRRFHDFDSLLLTVDLVPEMAPHSDRNMIIEGISRGLIPRFLDPSKRSSNEGILFQTMIWSFDDDPNREEGSASIAPSMPGSLFEAGGLIEVAAGAAMWGFLIAFLDRFKTGINAPIAAGLQVMWSTQALAGIERDYAAAFANMIQVLVMLLVVCYVLSRRQPSHQVPALEAEAPAIQ